MCLSSLVSIDVILVSSCSSRILENVDVSSNSFDKLLQSYVLLLASLLQYFSRLPWQIQRTLLWSLSRWTTFEICLNSWTQKRRRLMTILQHVQLPYRFTWTIMDLVDTVIHHLHALGFVYCQLLHWCHRSFSFRSRTESSSKIPSTL